MRTKRVWMHYLFTVGTNPLPVAMSALYFQLRAPDGERDSHFHLFYSDESQSQCARIEQLLRKKGIAPESHRLSKAGDGETVCREINTKLRSLAGPLHLHFTGGTSVMAAYGMWAVKAKDPKAQTSYLALYTNRLTGDGVNDRDLRREISLTFDQLSALHGYYRCVLNDKGPIPALTDRLAPLVADWSGAKEFNDEAFGKEARIRGAGRPDHLLSTQSEPLARELNAAFGAPLWQPNVGGTWTAMLATTSSEFWDVQHFFRKNGWFELKALLALKAALDKQSSWQSPDIVLARHYGLDPDGKVESRAEKLTFEIDVAVVFGYQLVLVSCTSSKKEKDLTKLKAFEALHRARQLGGVGARAIFIASQEDDTVAANTQLSLHRDIGFDPNAKQKPLEIWGVGQAANLEESFQTYIDLI